MTTAAASLDLSGPFARQGKQAARARQWWAAEERVSLRIEDDTGSISVAARLYERWLDEAMDILVGPYGTGLVHEVGHLVAEAGVKLWNHGGSGDHVARPLVVSVTAPASSYFHDAVRLAAEWGMEQVVLLVGNGRFAATVSSGARSAATRLGLSMVETSITNTSLLDELGRSHAVLVVGRFEEDVSVVEYLQRHTHVGLIGCVAAGLREFGLRAGRNSEGVIGPVQWLPTNQAPEVGVSGTVFARSYRREIGVPPDYVAAQAAAAGFLAAGAHRARFEPEDILKWTTSTLLGAFRLDESWRQVGHRVQSIRWRSGRQERIV